MQQLINGLSLGSLYALIAIGYTILYGILRLINFAHGDIFMMAAYFACFGIAVFFLPWYVTFMLTVVLTILLGITIEKVAYGPLRDAPKTSPIKAPAKHCWPTKAFKRPIWAKAKGRKLGIKNRPATSSG